MCELMVQSVTSLCGTLMLQLVTKFLLSQLSKLVIHPNAMATSFVTEIPLKFKMSCLNVVRLKIEGNQCQLSALASFNITTTQAGFGPA